MIKRILLAVAAAALLAGPAAGCADKKEAASSSPLHVGFEPNLAQDLKSMSQRAEIVVLGKFSKEYSTFNGSRDPRNPKQPSKQVYSEARAYRFQVEKALKGRISSTIRVNLLYNQQIDGLVTPDGKPLKLTIPSPTFFEPDPAKTYLLFLKKDPDAGGYSIDFQPYAIAFDASGKAELIKPKDETVAVAKDPNNQERQVNIHSFSPYYIDSVTGMPLGEVVHQVQSYLK